MPDYGPCACRERKEAAARAEFFEWVEREGWVFTDGPLRSLTRGANYWKEERYIEDHSGEAFVFTVCPWCGCDLPLTKPEPQATGEDGG